jgi:phospholipid/cholesterol/gamma-HCH transport system substrate-binding protein
VKHALLRHRREMVALAMLIFVAMGITGWILLQQPAFHPPGWLRPDDKNRFVFTAEMSAAPGLVAGQGQTVNIAGVTVGDINSIDYENGLARLELSVKRKYVPIYRNARLLIRPRTALKDMYVALEPGTPDAGELPQNGNLPVSQTLPDVNYDELWANLDADTRAYLAILLGSGGRALRDPPNSDPGEGAPSEAAVSDLRGLYKRFEPLARDSRELFGALRERRESLRSAVNSLQKIVRTTGDVNQDLAKLIGSSERTFAAFAAQDDNLKDALAVLPDTLTETDRALVGLTQFGTDLGPTLENLRPFARSLGPALSASRPFFAETTPVVRSQLRPFARNAQPVLEELRPAARQLAETFPHIKRSFEVLNAFFNALGFNPKGSEEGYLFWGAWLAHMGPSLLNTQDAHGAMPRAIVLATCAQLDAIHQVELGNPSLGPILRLLNLADREQFCDTTDPFATPTPAGTATATATVTAAVTP